ncbi:hypothetical protein [Streptomyces microflavus]|uniref:hypothetical protein n=1 Tax=Streptomyces microflavus TaxID=1919 RepID=UPI001E48DD5B|nr:hypothetical protein [Streptomyces microflavus]
MATRLSQFLTRILAGLRQTQHQRRQVAPSSLALCEEAVAAARSSDPAETAWADVLYRALDSCQRQLYMAGRRAEGLAVRAEMLAIGRAQAEVTGHSEVRGLEDWAAGLSEEGRYAEAADVMTELVTAMLPRGRRSGALAWSLLEWIAALHDAGRSGEALAAFETLVGMEAAEAANDNGPMACHLHSLIGYARMLDTHGRGEQAAHVRQDALALLTELAVTGERNSWSGYQASFWAVLLTMRSHCPLRRLLGAPHSSVRGAGGLPVRRRSGPGPPAVSARPGGGAANAGEDPDRPIEGISGQSPVMRVSPGKERCRAARMGRCPA